MKTEVLRKFKRSNHVVCIPSMWDDIFTGNEYLLIKECGNHLELWPAKGGREDEETERS